MQTFSKKDSESKPCFEPPRPMTAEEYLEFLDDFRELFTDRRAREVIEIQDARL